MKTKVFVLLQLLLCGVALGQDVGGPVWIDLAYTPALPVGGIASVPQYDIPAHYTADMFDLVNGGLSSKPIYFWALDLAVFRNERNHSVIKSMSQFARTGIPVRGPNGGWTEDDWKTADMLGRAIGNGVVLHESPYHRVRGCTQDLGDNADYAAELAYLGSACAKLKDLGIDVTAVVLDSECYKTPSAAVTERLNEAYHEVRRHFARIPIIWYRNGDWAPMLDADCGDIKTIHQYRTYSPEHTELWMNEWYLAFSYTWGVWTPLGPGYGWHGYGGWRWKLDKKTCEDGGFTGCGTWGMEAKDYTYLGRMHKGDARLSLVVVYPHPARPLSMPESLDAWIAYAKAMQE